MFILIDADIKGKGNDYVYTYLYDNFKEAQETLKADFDKYISQDDNVGYKSESYISDDHTSAWVQTKDEYKFWMIK